jgi:hypothetical protein
VTPLERRNAADLSYEAFFRDYIEKNKPVVLEDVVPEWPALGKWTPTYFKTEFGSKLVNVGYGDPMTFSDFIDAVLESDEEKPAPYMYRFFIGPHMPELLSDLQPLNAYAFPGRLASPLMLRQWRRPDGYLKLLIGGVGGKFPYMHFDGDNMHAAITEIYGEKEFIVYAPEDTPYLYPYPDRENKTRIEDLVNPDFERFPLFAKARRYHTVLRPGEMIFVPSRWWHTARVLTPSISICQNILNRSNWDGFVNWVCRRPRPGGPSRLKRYTADTYFRLLGMLFSMLEKAPGRGTPQTRTRPGLPARLAPTYQWEAARVGEWPVNKWIVRH